MRDWALQLPLHGLPSRLLPGGCCLVEARGWKVVTGQPDGATVARSAEAGWRARQNGAPGGIAERGRGPALTLDGAMEQP